MISRTRTRAVVISQVPPPHHGSTIMTVVLLETLASLGFETRLVDRRFSTTIDQVGRTSLSKVFRGVGLLWRLGATLARFRPASAIFFVTNRPASFIVDWAISETLRLTRTEVVAYVHTRGYESLAARNVVFRWMVGRLLGASAQTVCLGSSLTTDIERWVAPGTVSIIQNTPLEVPTSPAASLLERTRVLFLSNLIAEKGADTFVELSLRLFSDYPDISFTVAGSAVDASVLDGLLEAVHSAGAPNVEFWGQASAEQKWQLLSDAKVLVFPSRYEFEAQPLTIIEAMSVGTPTIAFDIGGIRDIVGGDLPGILIPQDDIDTLESALREYLDDARLQASSSEQARKAFDAHFALATYTDKWSRVLDGDLIGR